MAHDPHWPEITEEEIEIAISRDYTADLHEEVASYLEGVSSNPKIKMAVLCRVKGRIDLIQHYQNWDWRDILVSTDWLELERFRPPRPL